MTTEKLEIEKLLLEYEELSERYHEAEDDGELQDHLAPLLQEIEQELHGTEYVCKECGRPFYDTALGERTSYNGLCAYCEDKRQFEVKKIMSEKYRFDLKAFQRGDNMKDVTIDFSGIKLD